MYSEFQKSGYAFHTVFSVTIISLTYQQLVACRATFFKKGEIIMLSADFLSELELYIQSHYRPGKLNSFNDCAKSEKSIELSLSQNTPEPDLIVDNSVYNDDSPEFSNFTASSTYYQPCPYIADSLPADDDFMDIINIFRHKDNIQKYVSEHQNPSFSSELMRLIDESGCKDSEIYNRAGIDRRHFSKIRSNSDYHPSKQTAIALCLALRLNKPRSEELLSCAGYSFSSSEIFDLIISYCMENGIYELADINTALVSFSLKPLGVSE